MLLNFLEKIKVKTNKSIENLIPRNINLSLFNKIYVPDMNIIQEEIVNPIYDLLDRGGKRWRPAIMYLSYKAIGGSNNKLIEKYLAIPEIIHNASLIHDDIEDKSKIRRGKECIHLIYGEDISINVGSIMYFLPLDIIFNSNININKKNRILKLYYEEIKSLHLGQAIDIHWSKNSDYDILEKQYLDMCKLKTGVLARFSTKLGVILANGTKEQENVFYEFAQNIGVAFQIQDDILDLEAINHTKFSKIHGSQDIKDGKVTLMIIHTLKKSNKEDKKKLLSILTKKNNSKMEIKKALLIIKKYKSISYAKSVAKKIVENSWKDLSLTLKESKYKKLLNEFKDFVINREI